MQWTCQNLLRKVDLANLKSDVDKLDIVKLKNVPANLSNLKSKVYKVDVYKLVPVSVDLSKLSDLVKNDIVKKDVHNANIKKILKIKYVILLTLLLMLLLMLE